MTRNVLFSFVGETPQVVTETLYCLLRDYNTSDGEVHLLTTRKMEENAFGLTNEWINRFNSEYDTGWEPCTDANFAWTDAKGGVQVLPIEDINNEDANDKAIDAITRIIYYWTSQDDVKLYVSVAGGRKQLGSYMYQALSWFGRPDQTRLCHVIPSKELEGDNPDGWVGGYFPEPGTGESSCEKAIYASHDEDVNFVEQPVIYLKRLLPNFFGNNKVINFTQPYLDEEKKSATFPFVNKVELGNYLTFDSMCRRYNFMQGLFKDSPEPVRVFLDIRNNNFILISNKLKKSLRAEDMTLFLFYFLYKIKKINFRVFEKENLIKFFKEKENLGKVLKEKFKGKIGKKVLKEKFGEELFEKLGEEHVKELHEELVEELSEELGEKNCYNSYFFINQSFNFMSDENLVNIYDQSLSKILGNKKILDYKDKEVVIREYHNYDYINYYKCYCMTDVKIDDYIGYNININNKLDYKTLTLLLGGNVYEEYIKRINEAIAFLEFLRSDAAKEIIITIKNSIRYHNGNGVNIAVTNDQLELIKYNLSNGKNETERKVKEYRNAEKFKELLDAIADNINSVFSKLIKLQDEFAPSGLKISIITTPQRSRSENPILRPSSRYLEIDVIKFLDVEIGKE